MSDTYLEPGQVTCCPDIVPDLAPVDPDGLAGPASAGRAYPPNASVVLAGTRALHGMGGASGAEEQPSPWEQLLGADVVASDGKPIIGGTRLDRRISDGPCLARTRRTMP
jgi:hypothetical protein